MPNLSLFSQIRRFSRLIAILVLLFTVGSLLSVVRAADGVVLSGRVYNGSTGVGYAGVNLNLCGAGSAATEPNGNWQVTVPSGTAYCVRVMSGAPAGLAGPAVRNNPDVGARSSYEYQQAGVNCYHNSSCDANLQQWDRPVDGGLDFVYTVAVAVPAATPASSSAATPDPATPTPAAASPVPAGLGFTAELGAGSSPLVKLHWQSVGDGATYQLERSLDRETWAIVVGKLTDLSYDDHDVAPDVHYYYRLTPTLPTGQAGDPALADVTVGKVLGSATDADATYGSADGVASVLVPVGTIAAEATCSVLNSNNPLNLGGRTLIVGPYELSCHDVNGALITDFKHDVIWRLKLGSKMQGAEPPQLVRSDQGNQADSTPSSYDKTQRLVSATLPATGRIAVFATPIDWGWLNYVAIGGLVLAGLIVLVFIPIRHRRKLSYQEYLRAKYYNL